MLLKDQTALVTGGGRGIGRAIVKALAGAGAKVAFVYRSGQESADSLVQEVTSDGGVASAIQGDVGEPTCAAKVVEKVIGDWGRLDILVNNAGVAHIGNAENTLEGDFDRVISVNIKGAYNCIHSVIPYMKQRKKGVILNMASVAATVGIPDRFAYSMSKGAIITMTLSVAKDFIKDGIRCNCISPARVHTPFVDGYLAKNYPGKEKEMYDKLAATQPIGRMAEPNEIGYLALYLCSDEAGFITGCDYPIDGGFTRLNN